MGPEDQFKAAFGDLDPEVDDLTDTGRRRAANQHAQALRNGAGAPRTWYIFRDESQALGPDGLSEPRLTTERPHGVPFPWPVREIMDSKDNCRPSEPNDVCGGCPECLVAQHHHSHEEHDVGVQHVVCSVAPELCSKCEGWGRTWKGDLWHKCKECDGLGWYTPAGWSISTCTLCDGDGEVQMESRMKIEGVPSDLKSHIKIKCERCAGSGSQRVAISPHSVTIGVDLGYTQEQDCPECDGMGGEECETCHGSAAIFTVAESITAVQLWQHVVCPKCQGKCKTTYRGREWFTCERCQGSGQIATVIDVGTSPIIVNGNETWVHVPCVPCEGGGKIWDSASATMVDCEPCNGSGDVLRKVNARPEDAPKHVSIVSRPEFVTTDTTEDTLDALDLATWKDDDLLAAMAYAHTAFKATGEALRSVLPALAQTKADVERMAELVMPHTLTWKREHMGSFPDPMEVSADDSKEVVSRPMPVLHGSAIPEVRDKWSRAKRLLQSQKSGKRRPRTSQA